MRAVFIESSEVTEWVRDYLPDESYAALQRELMADPEKGTPMPGCGGLRKVRTPDPRRGKGKRGGARVIYLHVPDVNQFFLLDVFGKDEKDDLSPQEKRILATLADQLKRRARSTAPRRKGGRSKP